MGDLICLVPALRALRRHYRRAEICLISLPWAAPFADRFGKYLDRFIEFPGYPGLPEQPYDSARTESFMERMRRERFDIVWQMHGSGEITNRVAADFQAKEVVGYGLTLPWQEEEHEVVKYLMLVKARGIPLQGNHLEFPVSGEEKEEYLMIRERAGLTGRPYTVLHPGAKDPRKRHDPALFARLGDTLEAAGFATALTGIRKEIDLLEQVEHFMAHHPANLGGQTGLGCLAELLRNAELVIANDTGVSHLAQAVGTKSIILFTAHSSVERWGPLDRKKHVALTGGEAATYTDIIGHVWRLLGEKHGNLATYQFSDHGHGL